MKNLGYLNKYFKKYRGRLLWGFFLIIVGNIFSVYAPVIVRDGINFLTDALQASKNASETIAINEPQSFHALASFFGMDDKPIVLTKTDFAPFVIKTGLWLAVLYLIMFLLKGVFLDFIFAIAFSS